MRLTNGLSVLSVALALVSPVALSESARFDHHDPAALNEEALRRLKVGEGGTALILLERAATIVPNNETIRRNLYAVRAYLARPGSLESSAKPIPPPPETPAALPLTDSLAPWPTR